jgi:hypothetical protein
MQLIQNLLQKATISNAVRTNAYHYKRFIKQKQTLSEIVVRTNVIIPKVRLPSIECTRDRRS